MKKSKVFLVSSLLAVSLAGTSACSHSSSDKPAAKNESKPDITLQSTNDDSSTDTDNEQASNSSEQTTTTDHADSNKGTLSKYSADDIEYARVWLQLGANQDINGLYVRHISAGTPLNPGDETSVSYPEKVIQLSGSRLVDGSVTYSGNGDGTINIYNVPLRWDGQYPAGEQFYKDMIQNTKLVSIDPGENEKIVNVIKLLKEAE
ncbi:hypothetical protein [Bacillus sp. B-jedd]|uniref:hypothetical protein n=1 Tax=Bacillus sp. B-jedd TaxID=1476857 RepID=UPI0005155841|nr:hypothetical protein [Bacillus sp. B-jedd]CEG26216.1 lipoprotein [Bacillus sp. B-jedd]